MAIPLGVMASARSFSPKSITGLNAWYDASTISGFSDGASLTSWSDASGNGYHLAPAATAPLYRAGIIGANIRSDKGVVHFNSSIETRALYNTTEPNGDAPEQTIVAVVYRASGMPTVKMGITSGADNVNGGLYLAQRGTAGTSYPYEAALTASGVVDFSGSNLVMSEDRFNIIIGAYSDAGNLVRYRQNGSEQVWSGVTSSLGASTGRVVGAWQNRTADYWFGYMAEILHYTSYLTTEQCQQLEAYLTAKWSIT